MTAKIVEAARSVGTSLLDSLKGLIEGPEAAPPVGAQDTFWGIQPGTPTAAVTVGGISTGTLIIIALAWFLLKQK